MRKLIAILILIFISSTLIFAQTAKPAAKKAATEAKAVAPTKKDGTPDMRFKENKEAAKAPAAPAGPTKKDGTPDMRYKANKTAPAKK